MPTFKINDIFKIADRGQVLSGQIIDDGFVFSGDKIILTINNQKKTNKIIGVINQKENKHYGLLISFEEFDKINLISK